jgi:hypothetical protein
MGCDDNTLNLTIKQGKTFTHSLQWERPVFVYKPIQTASQADPCVLGVAAHGMPDQWHFRIVNAGGMTQLNADEDTRLGANGLEEYRGTVVDAGTIELNDVAAAGFPAYTGGGSIVYRAPYSLAGFTARMQAKVTPEDVAPTLNLTSANGGVVLDDTLKTITIVVTDVQSAALEPGDYLYDLELVDGGGAVTEIVHGVINVPTTEITT